MDRAARLLRGTLRVRVESAFPERVLNLCGAHGIAFSDLRWESVSALSFTVRAAERKQLARLLAPLDAALTVERAAGAPAFLRRFRRRKANPQPLPKRPLSEYWNRPRQSRMQPSKPE